MDNALITKTRLMSSNDGIDNYLWEELETLREDKTKESRARYYLGRVPETPKLVLSVIGDSSSFVPKPWFTSVFKAGLIETAKGAKDCLILYKGSTEKISTIVRGAVDNFEKLSTDDDDNFISLVGLQPKIDVNMVNVNDDHYELAHQDNHQYGREHWKMSNRVLEEMFNIRMKKDIYPEAHASILNAISKNKTSFMKLQENFLTCLVPVLTIVAEGDIDTIEFVLHVLKQNLPVLILKGSGKAADYIAGFICDGNSESSDEYVKDKTSLTFGVISDASQQNGLSEKLNEIKQSKCLVTLIDITTQTKPTEFSEAVTKAIIRGWSQKPDRNYNNGSNVQIGEKPPPPPDLDTLYTGTSSEECPREILPTTNKVHPMTITMSAVCEFYYDFHKKIGAFMESYKETLTPASLSLYYYIAYQFIQEMDDTNNGTENIKIQNFNILLKEAIVADRDEYVSVLLEENSVKFEEHHFPDIYEETVLVANKQDTDFQHILKWGSSSAVESLKSACHMKKIRDLLANTQEWLQRHPLKQAKDIFHDAAVEFNTFKDNFDEKTKDKPLDQLESDFSENEQTKLKESTTRAATCVSKIIGTLMELEYAKEALEWLKDFDKNDFTRSLTEESGVIPNLLDDLRKHATSLNRAIHLLKELADDQHTTLKTFQAIQDSYRKISKLLEEGGTMFSSAEQIVSQLTDNGVHVDGDPKYTDIFNKSIDEINSYSSQKCIKACRKICQSLLGYSKNCRDQEGSCCIQQKSNGGTHHEETSCEEDQQAGSSDTKDYNETHSDSSFQDLLIWAILANRPKLATIFWMKCNNQLLCALLASSVYKEMAYKVKSARDQSFYEEMMQQSKLFESRALHLQQRLYEDDAKLAMDLVITEGTVWNITISPLECAHENNMLDFIAHTSAQRRINKIWYNEIGASLGGVWKKGFFTGCYCCCKRGWRWSWTCGCCCECIPKTFTFMLPQFLISPLAKFLVHYAFFLAALICYSAFLLTELDFFEGVGSVKIYEWIVYIYIFGDICEEYRHLMPCLNEDSIVTDISQHISEDVPVSLRHSCWYKFKKYLFNFWNFLDVLSYSITITAICIRFFKSTTSNNLARRFYSLSLFTMYMRFLHVILMSRKLGPKVIMIKEMLKDLFRFIGILFVFMLGVGVLYHANMYPKHVDMWNPAGWEYWRIWKIIYIPYWQIYGDSFLDTFSENSTAPCTSIQSEWENNPDIERCNQYDWVLLVIASLYMLISNLLLVNLVIALFSYRFERVQENSEKLWRYLRYEVIMDYNSRIPAPLNIIIRPLDILCRCCKGDYKRKQHKPDRRLVDRINTLQSVNAINCVYNI
ncbi:uncharacterized protein LOC134714381 [Mytilus trossulus]|uniref:uncharacterized protein LOC134714381 n=1 Tax=Mytilus trossulus TaxID=6551 RepID=UPI00300426B0